MDDTFFEACFQSNDSNIEFFIAHKFACVSVPNVLIQAIHISQTKRVLRGKYEINFHEASINVNDVKFREPFASSLGTQFRTSCEIPNTSLRLHIVISLI